MAETFLIVGGGLVGAASALRLQAAGFQTTLLDPGDPRRGASFGNAGCIAAEQVAPLSSFDTLRTAAGHLFAFGGPLDFRWRDIGLWAPWSARFLAATTSFAAGQQALAALMAQALPGWERLLALAGTPQLLVPDGHAVVWMSPDRGRRGIDAWGRAAIGTTRFDEMSRADLDAYSAVLRTPPAAGIRFSGTGQLRDPQGARDALLAALSARGGIVRKATVRTLSADERVATAMLEGDETLNADFALVAAGAWSRRLMHALGVDAPVIAERGYSIQSTAHSWPDHLPSTIFEERSVVLTRFSTGLRATSFLEFGAPDAPADPRKWRRLSRHLDELGLEFSPEPARWMGPRPTLPDYLPAIGRLRRAPRIFYAFGHQHLGLTLAAATSEAIEALARSKETALDIAPFRLERFGH